MSPIRADEESVSGGLESYISVSASMSGSQHKAGLAAALRGDQGENPFTLEQSGCIDVREVKKKKKKHRWEDWGSQNGKKLLSQSNNKVISLYLLQITLHI